VDRLKNNRTVKEQFGLAAFLSIWAAIALTNAGILLFGLDVRKVVLPGAYIQFLRVQGDSLAASGDERIPRA